MNTKFFPISQPSIGTKEREYVAEAVRSGWVSSLGAYIEKFEVEFAAFCNSKYAITTSNGTTALHLALLASGVQPGDEVIVPDLTFVATANAVVHAGAIPVFVDVEPDSLCICPDALEAAITRRSRAVVPVHLYGHPADMDRINEIAQRHSLSVIEDAAEAHGAQYKGRAVGSLGLCGIFSFYGNKIVTSGEGGMITSNDERVIRKAKHLRDHAMSATKRYWHDEIGYNYRMTNLQAALGVGQLERVHEFLERRLEIMAWYRSELADCARVRLNRQAPWARSAHWMVCLEVEGLDEESRSLLMHGLKSAGVDSRPYFYPISDMPMYKRTATPVAHRISPTGINLPCYVGLSRNDIAEIGSVVKRVLLEVV